MNEIETLRQELDEARAKLTAIRQLLRCLQEGLTSLKLAAEDTVKANAPTPPMLGFALGVLQGVQWELEKHLGPEVMAKTDSQTMPR